MDKNGQNKTEIVLEHSQIIYGSTNYTVFNNYVLHYYLIAVLNFPYISFDFKVKVHVGL